MEKSKFITTQELEEIKYNNKNKTTFIENNKNILQTTGTNSLYYKELERDLNCFFIKNR